MKTRKRILTVCIIAGIIVLCMIILLATAGVMSAKGYGISVGLFYLSDTGYGLIDEGKAMIMSDQSDNKKLFDGLDPGDLILVIHGGVDESYPAVTGAYRVFRLRKHVANICPGPDIGVVKIDGTEDILIAPPVDFDAQYIRTNGYHKDVQYPVVRIIRSAGELNAYCEANKNEYSLERNFLGACNKYDDAYFEDKILVMVLLQESSGSNSHKVRSVNVGGDGQCYIYIDRIVPEAGTCDMAQWHILIEPEAGVEIEKESDITVFLDGVNPLTLPELVHHSRRHANISLRIPDGWEYKTVNQDDSNDFYIAFWPAGESEGKIRVWYYDFFSVCGTGLEQEKITLGNYEAYKSTYDNREVWDFISLVGTPGCYVIINDGADAWLSEYGDEVMQILDTIVVGENIISETDAIAIAEKNATVKYNEKWASFDSESGYWTVSLSKRNSAGGDQVITITHEGEIADIKYGE